MTKEETTTDQKPVAIVTSSKYNYLRFLHEKGLIPQEAVHVSTMSDVKDKLFSRKINIDGHLNVTDKVKSEIKLK